MIRKYIKYQKLQDANGIILCDIIMQLEIVNIEKNKIYKLRQDWYINFFNNF